MQELYIGIVAIGGMVLVLGLCSDFLKRTVLSAPMLALLFGIAMGPAGLGLLHPAEWGLPSDKLLEEAARLTLAIGLMGIALRLPRTFVMRRWRDLSVLLVLVMPLMCLSVALLAYLLLGVSPLVALLIGAIVTPTDPIVATSIVTGKLAEANVPATVRHTLSAESGANDGLAFPLVLLPTSLLIFPVEQAWPYWIGRSLWSVAGAVVLGATLGFVAGRLLHWAEAAGTMDKHSFLAYTVSLSLLAVGSAKLASVEALVAVFVAGIAFDQVVGGRERAEEENVQEAVNQFFTLPIFVLFGMLLPWDQWARLGWLAVALAAAILLLRRLPALLLLRPLLPALSDVRASAYAGWFGPIGVAALLYASMAKTRTGEELVWTVGSLVVFASLLVHGMTATPLTKLYGRSDNGNRP